MSTVAIGTPDTLKNTSNSSTNSLSPSALTSVVSTPRVGTEFKDRIFVGGFPPTTSDNELRSFFAKFGNVKEAKIIRDHSGASKGYGFITYETEEEAKKVRDSCGGFLNGNNGDELLDFKGRKLNVGPAIRKASNSRMQNLDVIPQGAVVLSANGTPFVVQNGLAFCATPDAYSVTQPTVGGSYPFMLPQQYFVAHPPFVIPSSYPPGYPSATSAMHQMSQSHMVLSPVPGQHQQTHLSQQQHPHLKSSDSPRRLNTYNNSPRRYSSSESPQQMNPRYAATESPRRNNVNSPRYSTPHRSSSKFIGRGSPAVGGFNNYGRNNYGCPECEVQSVTDVWNQTGFATPPPTPITMDFKN